MMDPGVRKCRKSKGLKDGLQIAHLSIHLDGLRLQSSAPSPPERFLVRPPGVPARPQPQLSRVALHHEEALVLGQRQAVAVQRLRPDLAESPGRQQRDQGE